MADETDFEAAFPTKADEYSFGEWLKDKLEEKEMSVPELAEASGITNMGIYNIVNGITRSPRDETRKALAKALKVNIPKSVEEASEELSNAGMGLEWVDFTPSDLNTIPAEAGIYVFYDITDRPVYVGKSNRNVRMRIKDHSSRFWFKEPLVVRGSYLSVSDNELCNKLEMVLIRFMGKHALLNSKGAVRDFEE